MGLIFLGFELCVGSLTNYISLNRGGSSARSEEQNISSTEKKVNETA